MKNILVVGSINMDMVITVDRVPHMGETVSGKEFMTAPGGKGANQALAAARLGGKVRMLGRIGTDSFGTELINYLTEGGVDTSSVKKSQTNTGVALITVCNGDNMIILEKGANYSILPEDIDKNKDFFEWADLVIMQFEIPLNTVLTAAKCAKANNCTVVLNPAPVEGFSSEILDYIDIIVPNEYEGGIILGKTSASVNDARQLVLDFAAKNVQAVVTLGSDGSVYYSDGQVKHCPAQKTNVIDTTAAGDSFIAGLCVALCEGKNFDDSVSFATKVAAITVSRKGAGTSLPYRSEIQ